MEHWKNMSPTEQKKLSRREARRLTLAERDMIQRASDKADEMGFSASWVLRRVENYDWIEGLVLVNGLADLEYGQPWFMPVSESVARRRSWKPRAERPESAVGEKPSS